MRKILLTVIVSSTHLIGFGQNMGINIDMNVDGMPDMGVNMTETQTTTTSTTTTTTNAAPVASPAPDHYVMPGYNGPIGCPWPMDENQFANAKRSVESKSFDDAKMTVAKQITGSNCLTADQVRRMMAEMSFESAKLEYAKFAYNKTFDIGNYYVLNDAFDFSSSVEELNNHINGK
jgi:hypothetical protein